MLCINLSLFDSIKKELHQSRDTLLESVFTCEKKHLKPKKYESQLVKKRKRA